LIPAVLDMDTGVGMADIPPVHIGNPGHFQQRPVKHRGS
jgi:hypothetical protein